MSPPSPFPVHTRPGCKLFSLMLDRRSLGKPRAAGTLGAEGGTGFSWVPCLGEGEALSSFHPTQGDQNGVCAAKYLFFLPSAGSPQCFPVQLCTPPPASQGWGHCQAQEDPSGHPRAKVWRGASRRTPPPPEHHRCAVVALASRPLIKHLWLTRPVS